MSSDGVRGGARGGRSSQSRRDGTQGNHHQNGEGKAATSRSSGGPPSVQRTDTGGSWRTSGPPSVKQLPPRAVHAEPFVPSISRQPPSVASQSSMQQNLLNATEDKRKLLILDINGVLLKREDFTQGKKRSYILRPHCQEFLKWAFANFACALWSCAKRDTMEMEVFSEFTKQVVFIRAQDDSTNLWPRRSVVAKEKPLFLKDLNKLFAADKRWTEHNTILLDNHAEKFERNPPGTSVLVPDFISKDDSMLSLEGPLVKHLQQMLSAPSLKDHALANLDTPFFSFLALPRDPESFAEYDQRVLRGRFAELFTSSQVMKELSPERDVNFYMNYKDIPGPRAKPFRRSDLRTLASALDDYVVCEKTDGTRMIFFIPPPKKSIGEGEPFRYGYFLDRAWNFEVVLCNLDGPLALASQKGGLILDGELVSDGPGSAKPAVYLIFDAVFLNGADVGAEMELATRLSKLKQAMHPRESEIVQFQRSECTFIIKPFSRLSDLADLHVDYALYPTIGRLKCDGLVFTPSKNVSYYQTMVLKFKPANKLTVDFMVEIKEVAFSKQDRFPLKLGDGIVTGELMLTSETRRLIAQAGGSGSRHQGAARRIVECEFDLSRGLWRLVSVRLDKSKSNSVSTAWNVLESIAENLSLSELVTALAHSSPKQHDAKAHYDNLQQYRDEDGELDEGIKVLRKLNNFVKGALISTGGHFEMISSCETPVANCPPLLVSKPKAFPKKRGKQTLSSGESITVLDLACGRGGDLSKWFRSHPVMCYVGMDVSPLSLSEAERRSSDMDISRNKCIFIESDLNQTDFVAAIQNSLAQSKDFSALNGSPFDYVSIQFALHYFCDSPESCKAFLLKVKHLCGPKTRVLVTMLDDAAVRRMLAHGAKWENEVCKIEVVDKNSFRSVIRFTLGDAVVGLPEPLVSFEEFVKVCDQVGFKVSQRINISAFLTYCASLPFAHALHEEIVLAMFKADTKRGVSPAEWQVLGLYCMLVLEVA